jgi:CubicO group peptidase (beta-lactamase class C family)
MPGSSRPAARSGLLTPILVLAVLLSGVGLEAQTGEFRFAPDRLARIDSVFLGMVERGQMAGAVALVLREGEPAYERAFGWADREAGRPMTTDAIFRIASQTKAITSVAIMMLAEEGKLSLSDPVSRFIPAYRNTSVAVQGEGGPTTTPARRQITIRDLLTHSAGISYGNDPLIADAYAAAGFGRAAGFGWYTADKSEPICDSMERLASLPFVAQPGERFVYGYNTDILGCVVERASGSTLDRFFRDRITGPLGMTDTEFFLSPDRASRLTAVYTVDAGGITRAPEGARGQGDYLEGPRRSFAGGAGLLSTARDYSRFLQMLLNGGELEGVRILSPKSVELMTTNQLGTLFSQQGEGFSLGFRTLETPGALGRIESAGTYGWGGAYGTAYWVDPAERLVLVLLLQELPNTSGIAGRFPMLVYQALVDR